MFYFDQDINIPPCCDQKYWRCVWEELKDTSTTVLWHGADYSLSMALRHLVLHIPMSELVLATPGISDALIGQLTHMLGTHWYDEHNKNAHQLERLTLIVPPDVDADDLQQQFAAFGNRAKIYTAPFAYTMLQLQSTSQVLSVYGTTLTHVTQQDTTRYQLTITKHPQLCQEIARVLHAATIRRHTSKGGGADAPTPLPTNL